MAYLSLYRKYRPQKFADVAGQDHVVQTLQNALKMGRIAHGYLFCGTRGVAKTTLARIFAKCLNCVGPDGSRTTPTPEPCNECIPCKTISAGQCVDVIEMDAASNRSVADIAKLREGVQFGPMENRYKTYIVDEAHQLSSDAKDAFLKTLEEPPAHVVFILATTEAHAIPVTIASRCQHFEFKRGSIAQIVSRLDDVLSMEGVSMEPEAVLLVARAAEGSYRDSLSLLEQVLAYKREGITAHDVAEVLGTVQSDILAAVVGAVAHADAARAFAIAEEVFAGGKDVRQFLKALSARFRDMLFISVGAKVSPEDAGSLEDTQQLREQAALFTPASLLKGLETLAEAEREIRFNNQHRLLLEMSLLSLMRLPGAAVATTVPAPQPQPLLSPMKRPEKQTNGAPPRIEKTATNAAPPSRTAPQEQSDMSEEVADEEEEILSAVPEPEVSSPARELNELLDEPTASRAEKAGISGHEVEYLRKHWQVVIHHAQARYVSSVKLVSDATPVAIEGQTITLAFSQKVYVDMMDNARRRNFIEEIINKTLQSPQGTYHIKAALAKDTQPKAEALPPARKASVEAAPPASLDLEGSSELLDEVIAVFGGKIIEGEG